RPVGPHLMGHVIGRVEIQRDHEGRDADGARGLHQACLRVSFGGCQLVVENALQKMPHQHAELRWLLLRLLRGATGEYLQRQDLVLLGPGVSNQERRHAILIASTSSCAAARVSCWRTSWAKTLSRLGSSISRVRSAGGASATTLPSAITITRSQIC